MLVCHGCIPTHHFESKILQTWEIRRSARYKSSSLKVLCPMPKSVNFLLPSLTLLSISFKLIWHLESLQIDCLF